MSSTHDLGTVRIFELSGVLDVHCPKGDTNTREAVKRLKARWNPDRRCWRIDPAFARMDSAKIVETLGTAVLGATPAGWQSALPKLSQITSTTRKFALYIGAGGVRLELPRGHKHEYTLKNKIPEAELDGQSWLIPAGICDRTDVKGVLADCVGDDRKALGDCLDYLEGYTISGRLTLVSGELEQLGLSDGALVFSDPSFIRKVDDDIPAEPLKLYPLRVSSIAPGEDGGVEAKLRFVTGPDAYALLRERLIPGKTAAPVLDVRHVEGRWTRRRG